MIQHGLNKFSEVNFVVCCVTLRVNDICLGKSEVNITLLSMNFWPKTKISEEMRQNNLQ